MALWLDANALFFGARELRARAPELLRVIAGVGEVDAAVSVASYRAGTPGWTCPVLRSAGPVVLTDIRHPLLPDAVPNSLELAPPNGVIITGSNMSGKSTFLRTVGVTAVLAQTINTCLASRYKAPLFVVRSCIGLADDPATGKSYYLVEVESILALVHAASAPVPHLMLFDELFRGTNAVERIAAAEAVLLEFLTPRADARPSPHVVIAATHDQELVELSRTSMRHTTSQIRSTLQDWRSTTSCNGVPPELATRSLCLDNAVRHQNSCRTRSPAREASTRRENPSRSPAGCPLTCSRRAIQGSTARPRLSRSGFVVEFTGTVPTVAAGIRCRHQRIARPPRGDGCVDRRTMSARGPALRWRPTQFHTASSARLKSRTRSSMPSMPQLTRRRSSVMPMRTRSAGGTPACEVVAGRVMRLSTPPRLGAT